MSCSRGVRRTHYGSKYRKSLESIHAAASEWNVDRLDVVRRHVTSDILDTGSLKFGNFTLRSGITAPFYVELMNLCAHAEVLRDLTFALIWFICEERERWLIGENGEFRFEFIGDVPTGGTPIADALAFVLGIPRVSPQEARRFRGERVLIVEDVVTLGGSVLEAAKKFRYAGLQVHDALTVVERDTLGRYHLALAGIRLHAFLPVRPILALGYALGLYDKKTAERIASFMKS